MMTEKKKVLVYYNDISIVNFELEMDIMVFLQNEFEGYVPIVVYRDDVYEENGSYYLKYGSDMEPYKGE